MPTADLRALAERLGVLKPCEVCCEGRVADCSSPGELDACWSCYGIGQRLPTEAEVRAALFEAGVHTIEVTETDTGFAGVRFGGDLEYRVRVEDEEVETGTSVLLALLRALEACRG